MTRRMGATVCLIGLFLGRALAAEPAMEKTDLFEAGKGGYTMYRIPGIVVTTKGTILAYCEARKDAGLDWDNIDILMRRSTDRGKTWSAAKKIAQVDGPIEKNPVAKKQKLGKPGSVTYNNAVAIVDSQGAVHFLFCVEYMRCFYQRSDDDGQTFSRPVEITSALEPLRKTYNWKAVGIGPAHGIQLKNGRLLAPVWLSTSTGGNAHRPSVVTTIFSDDHGKTWKHGELVATDTDTVINPNETVVVELNDGRVMLNIRSESKAHRRLIVTSPDGSTRWSKPIFDQQLFEPICMGSICRLSRKGPQDRDRIVFANPHNPDCTKPNLAVGHLLRRKNLAVKLSYDEGKTWPVNREIDPGTSAYSDLAVGPDGTIYCLYERDSIDGVHFHTKYLTLVRFNLEWLSEGKDRVQAGK